MPPGVFPLTACFSLVLFLLLPCQGLRGIDRDRTIEQLHHTSWTLKDGGPGEVRALAQTTDGYLWIGAGDGLFRFDGVRFEPFAPDRGDPFQQRAIYSLLATPDGGLWVGFWSGGACFIKDGIARHYNETDGLPARAVLAFLVDRQGITWAATGSGGLARLEGSRWRMIGADWNFEGTPLSLLEDRDGTIWVGTLNSVLSLAPGSHKFNLAADQLTYVMQLAQAPDGTLWMAETNRGVRPVPLNAKGMQRADPVLRQGSQAIRIDSQGSLWVGTLGDGLRRLAEPGKPGQPEKAQRSPEAEVFRQKDGLTSDYMYCVLEDREGNIWTGTNIGLDRFRQSPLVPVSLSLRSTITALVPGDDEGVWAGATLGHPLFRVRESVAASPQPFHLSVSSAYQSPDGDIWIATRRTLLKLTRNADPSQKATARIREDGGVSMERELAERLIRGPVDVADGRSLIAPNLPWTDDVAITPNTSVHTMTLDHRGRLWLSISNRGTFRLEDGKWTSLAELGGPEGSPPAAFTDSAGRIWFGFREAEIAVVEEDRIERLGTNEGLSAGDILAFSGGGSGVWVGGENGLAHCDGGRCRSVVPADGTELSRINAIIDVENSGLWFAERRGIMHIPREEVDAFRKSPRHRVRYDLYGMLDGLPAQLQRTVISRAGVQAADGVLWFATNEGVVWVDPSRLSRNTVPPPVLVTSLLASGQRYPSSQPVELPSGAGNLRIAYTALSLTVPERVRFRYRLDGIEREWQDVGTRREAIYTNLGPGHYRFRVIACNNSGVWNETGAVLHFQIAPAWYQTFWFRSLCGIAIAMAMWMLYRLRIRQVTEALQLRIGERLAERERIARELHDTLLQGVQGLILHFDAVRKQIPPGQPAHGMMERTLQMADRVLLEGRDRVRDLRSEAASVQDLAMRLASTGKELAEGGSTAFKVAVTGSPCDLNPIVRDEAYWIGREALVNAFRHAEAAAIEAEITYGDRDLRLMIRDDGRGIDQQKLDVGVPGHWGLAGMRERAQRIGGRLDIWSRPGAGTEADLRVPAKLAYASDSATERPRWFRRFRAHFGSKP